MSALEFVWDSRDLAVFRGKTVDKALSRALRLGGNQAARYLQKGATAFALTRKNLDEQVVVEDQRLSRPHRNAELRNFVWTLFVKGKPVPVAKFPFLDTRRTRSRNGVLVRIGAGSGTQRLTGAFATTLKSGHEGVFRRTGKSRLPIEEVFSSRLPKDFGGEVMTTLGDKTYRKLETAFKRGLDRELAKARRKGDA
jgi:hypothetical protein